MRRVEMAIAFGLALMASGCLVLSVEPLYKDDADLVFEPALALDWPQPGVGVLASP